MPGTARCLSYQVALLADCAPRSASRSRVGVKPVSGALEVAITREAAALARATSDGTPLRLVAAIVWEGRSDASGVRGAFTAHMVKGCRIGKLVHPTQRCSMHS
jgi:hypothetical protein